MQWKQICFETDDTVIKNKNIIHKILSCCKYAFIDREYEYQHRIRVRGIQTDDETVVKEICGKIRFTILEECPEKFFQNIEQFMLYCNIHHELDLFWFDYYFTNNVQLEHVIDCANVIADELSVTDVEGYNSHFSHFWGFFHTLNRTQQEGILQIFRKNYKEPQKKIENKMINISRYVKEIEELVVNDKLDFFSPQGYESVSQGGGYASKSHEITIKKARQEAFFYSKYYICNRWYLNALYVSMILMNIPVIDRFYINYVIAKEKYPIDEICKHYLNTGEEKIWLRKDYE